MICYHFIPQKSLLQVKKEGFLKPNTHLFLLKNIDKMFKKDRKKHEEILRFAENLPRNKFICTIPKNRVKSWANSGLIKEIEYFIKPDYVLEFKVPRSCKMFAREHVYQSPKEIRKKFPGKKMYMNIPEPHKTDIWVRYFKSTKRIKNESDLKKFKVPELWIGCKIPLNRINIAPLGRF